MGTEAVARRTWTPLEDSLLTLAVTQRQKAAGMPDWALIARHVPGRDRKACRKRWCYKLGTSARSGLWTPDEDQRLIEAFERFGSKWVRVARAVRTRNGDQCLKRWRNMLDPAVTKRRWDAHEDEILLDAVKTIGRNWAIISGEKLPGRTPSAIRHREETLRARMAGEASVGNGSASPDVSLQSVGTSQDSGLEFLDDGDTFE